MSIRSFTRPSRYIFAAMRLAFILLMLPGQSMTTVQTASRQATAGNIYVVNSTADEPDSNPLDDNCLSMPSGMCTLRAAILQANATTGADTISIPPGMFVLTRVASDDTANGGDLDITDDVTIQGAGSGATIVDGNGAVTNDRVFQILITANDVSLSGLTIRNGGGVIGGNGGGINAAVNRHLTMNDVRIENNTAFRGGGMYVPASGSNTGLDLNNVIIESNIVSGDGGGIWIQGSAVTLTNTTLHANVAGNQGGGLWGDQFVLTLRDSKVYSNTANKGGGLTLSTVYFGRIERTEIYSNTADYGGAIEIDSGPVMTLADSYLHNNRANMNGGAIDNVASLVISRTVIDSNSAGSSGGGLMMAQTKYPNNTIQILITESTLSRNTAQYGGAIHYNENQDLGTHALILRNSTVSGNSVSRYTGTGTADGGGIYGSGTARLFLFNTTVAGNFLSRFGGGYAVRGGGVFITSTAVITAQNTLIGDNYFTTGVTLPSPNDCFTNSATTSLRSLGYNLVETTTTCIIGGTDFGNIIGQDPKLRPLQNNGGSTLTQLPLAGSPAIDHGDNTACPSNDQRGFRRPIDVSCDIGAVEVGPYVYLPIVVR